MSTVSPPVRRRAAAQPSTGPRSCESPITTSDPSDSPGTKRRLPLFNEGFVSRPRLVASLIAAADVPVALIAAPAGYGKTAVLAEWALLDERPFAWVTLEEAHNTATSLAAAIVRALDEAAQPDNTGLRAGPRPIRRGVPGSGVYVASELARSLERRHAFVLVLDDVQVLHAPETLDLLRTLADNMPRGSQLALGSRTEPPLPLGRLRAYRALTEMRTPELAMTRDEAAALMSAEGVELSTKDVETLVERTEGWPVALYLATVAMRELPDPRSTFEEFGGDDRAVSEYLRDEVMSRLLPETVTFLRRTSIVDYLTGPVCDAVLDRHGSAALLSELARAGLLQPLDRKDETYRCPALLRQMLQGELRRIEPELKHELHCRASDWQAAHDDIERAIRHAIAGDDVARAGELLWASVPEYVTQGRNATMQRWLSNFTLEQIAAHPALALAAANSQLVRGGLDAVERWESAARRALQKTPPAERTAALEAGVAIMHAAVGRDGVVRMGEDAARAYKLEPEDSPWRAICCLIAGVARHLTGDRDAAQTLLEEGVRRAAIAAPNVQTLCLAQLALLAAEREDWESGAGFATRAAAQVRYYGLAEYPTSALVFAASAVIRTRRGRVEQARKDMLESRRLLGMLTDFMPWYVGETRIALARAALRLGDVPGARELLADASRTAQGVPDAIVLRQWIEDLEAQAMAASASAVVGPSLLTVAELRILEFLPTHFAFREIAERLYVSTNTVKTQAHAVYRKLDASSRSEAVQRATELGLLDQRAQPRPLRLSPTS
jgi:LuxR family maltose regulon positive regulatory protein